MTAFLVSRSTILHQEKWDAYVEQVRPIIENAGGRIIARRVKPIFLEGKMDDTPVTVIEFSDRDAIEKLWNSAEYQEAKKLRDQAAGTILTIIECNA
jgi:uncharacterized protein (DUF1330 family)